MSDKNSPEFIQFIRRILKDFGKLKKQQIATITAETHHETWRTAFTTKYEHPTVNYELYELYGDTSIAGAFLHYLRKKYPMLSESGLLTASVARLKINYLDTDTFASFSRQYGLAKWVNLPDTATMSETELSRYKIKHGADGIYEDVLEAFYGVTERLIDDYILDGLSTTVLRNMLTHMYENSNTVSIDFRYTSLFDGKTRFKQVIDHIYYRDFGEAPVPEPNKGRSAIFYFNDTDPDTNYPRVMLQVAFPEDYGSDQISRKRYTLATVSTGERQKIIEKKAAEIGIQVLDKSGYSLPNPKKISTDIEKLFGYISGNETARYYVPDPQNTQTIPQPAAMIQKPFNRYRPASRDSYRARNNYTTQPASRDSYRARNNYTTQPASRDSSRDSYHARNNYTTQPASRDSYRARNNQRSQSSEPKKTAVATDTPSIKTRNRSAIQKALAKRKAS